MAPEAVGAQPTARRQANARGGGYDPRGRRRLFTLLGVIALAVLASLEVARRHPDSQLTCYTLGCPRVGAWLD